jgi:hypothetical protein
LVAAEGIVSTLRVCVMPVLSLMVLSFCVRFPALVCDHQGCSNFTLIGSFSVIQVSLAGCQEL